LDYIIIKTLELSDVKSRADFPDTIGATLAARDTARDDLQIFFHAGGQPRVFVAVSSAGIDYALRSPAMPLVQLEKTTTCPTSTHTHRW
jgi:hypothetical protein